MADSPAATSAMTQSLSALLTGTLMEWAPSKIKDDPRADAWKINDDSDEVE
jgi:hypothetical protein